MNPTPPPARPASVADVLAAIPGAPTAARLAELRTLPEPPPPPDAAAEAWLALARTAARQAAWAQTCPHAYRDATVSVLQAGQQPERIQAWLGDPAGRILILTGEAGRGKTYAAHAAARLALARGMSAVTVKQGRYVAMLRPGGSDLPEHRIMATYAGPDVLVLDDLGAELDPTQAASDHVRTRIIDLLDERLDRGRRTIITTNLDVAQLTILFGDRIMSRLRDGATALRITGPDRRARGVDW